MSEQMKAIRFHGPRDIRFERISRPPAPGPGEVKVLIKAAGICGSDLHVSQTGAYVTQIPVIMGHEFSGRVEETGQGVTSLKPGDHVIGNSIVSCGECDFCRKGSLNLCRNIGFLGEVRDGAFCEETVLPESALIPIAADVPFQLSALAEPLAVALHAYHQSGADGSPRTLILGAGPIGALIHQVLFINGFHDVTIHDVSEYRRRTLSAVHPDAVNAPSGQYELVFETTGSQSVMESMIPDAVAKKGTLVMVGLFKNHVSFDFNLVVENEWHMHGCAVFDTELLEAVQMLENHHQRFRHIISHRFALKDVNEAFSLLLSPDKNGMKIIFEPDRE
jgi:(R,R)-butanediol dehydrogenase / meso-butanediol dehydrogenase / diacetyl reductase